MPYRVFGNDGIQQDGFLNTIQEYKDLRMQLCVLEYEIE